jgi:hypothetical protein
MVLRIFEKSCIPLGSSKCIYVRRRANLCLFVQNASMHSYLSLEYVHKQKMCYFICKIRVTYGLFDLQVFEDAGMRKLYIGVSCHIILYDRKCLIVQRNDTEVGGNFPMKCSANKSY